MFYRKIKIAKLLTGFLLAGNIVVAQDWKRFIAPGYQMLDTCSGDLDMDGQKDLLLVLKDDAEDKKKNSEEQRPLLLLIGQKDGTYYQASKNNEAVMCKSCGGAMGEPYQKMLINKGVFSVEHYGGAADRWADIITLKYDKKQKKWFLQKWTNETFNATEPEKKVATVRTPKEFGVVEFEKFRRD